MTCNKGKHENPLVSSPLKRGIWLSVFRRPVILGFEKKKWHVGARNLCVKKPISAIIRAAHLATSCSYFV